MEKDLNTTQKEIEAIIQQLKILQMKLGCLEKRITTKEFKPISAKAVESLIKKADEINPKWQTKSRCVQDIAVRHCVCYILYQNFKTRPKDIIEVIKDGINHRTGVYHSSKIVADLLEVQDELYTNIYEELMKSVSEML